MELLELLVDEGSFRSWDGPPNLGRIDPESEYAHDLADAREKSGVDESILTGEATLDGRRVTLVLGEFSFLAGSIGVNAAERLVAAIERATAEGLPVLASPTSGGTRMQEGTVAFLQMVKITAAIAAHKTARLPYLVYLRHPTTGGVLASWGSLGHVTVAEPGALIGFLGPRVFQALFGDEFPAGIQQAENLHARGVIDAVVAPADLRELTIQALDVILPREAPHVPEHVPEDGPDIDVHDLAELDAWTSIEMSRHPDRPGVRSLLRFAASDVVPLSGTEAGENDPGMLLALARFGSSSCVVLAQDRHGQTASAPLGPGGLREARRGMRLAADLNLPLVTVIDTPGAALSPSAEEGGLAGEIARSLQDMVTLTAPTLSVLLGQGSGGAALALIPADHTIAAQHAWLSPLPPEGAAEIVHRDVSKAPNMAQEQQVSAIALYRNWIVDHVVPEMPDATVEPEAFCRRLGRAIDAQLAMLVPQPEQERLAMRFSRYRHLGTVVGAPATS